MFKLALRNSLLCRSVGSVRPQVFAGLSFANNQQVTPNNVRFNSNGKSTLQELLSLELPNLESTGSENSGSLSADSILKRAASRKPIRGLGLNIDEFADNFKNQAALMSAGKGAALSVNVKDADSLPIAIKRLDGMIRRNSIIGDLRAQEFHIRKGKKKRMIRAKRHRKLFKEGFKYLLNMVKDAKRKGY